MYCLDIWGKFYSYFRFVLWKKCTCSIVHVSLLFIGKIGEISLFILT